MAEAFSFNILGIEQLMKNLEELPTRAMKKTVVRNACKKALRPVADDARNAAPRGHTGDTARSIRIDTKLKPSQRRGVPQDQTTVKAYVGSTDPLAHLIEFGTGERTMKGPVVAPISGRFVTVRRTGRMPARPFLRPAWDSNRGRILTIFAKEMQIQLGKAAARLAKRAAKGTLSKSQLRGLG